MTANNKFFITKKVLPNDLKIIFHQMPWSNSTTARLLVNGGSRFEEKEESGTAHFLEHMLFEGTKKYPSAKKLYQGIESFGRDLNAHTSKEEICYTSRILSENSEKSIEFLCELVFNSLLRKQDVEKEKGIIIQEKNQGLNNIKKHRWDILLKAIWSENHPMGRTNIGSKESILNIDKPKLEKYLKKFYMPNNLILAVAGKFNEEKILKEIYKTFGKLKRKSPIPSFKKINFKKISKEKVIIQKNPELHQADIIISFLTNINYTHPKKITFDILSTILGRRIFNTLIYEKGLAYSASAGNWILRDHGLLNITAGIDPHKVKETYSLINKIMGLEITKESVLEAKNAIKKDLLLDLSDSESFASFIADQEFYYGEILSPYKIIEKVNKITISEIKKLKKQIFRPEKMFLAVIGPEAYPDLERFLKKEVDVD